MSDADQLQQLRDLLVNCDQLKHLTFDDAFLLKFLRARPGDMNKALSLLVEYFAMRREHPDVFIPTKTAINSFDEPLFMVLPKRNVTGETITLLRPGKWRPEQHDLRFAFAASIPFFELACLDEQTQKNGFIELLDMRGISWRHLSHLRAAEIKFATDLTERTLPTRFKRIHVLFENKIVSLMFAIVKPFLSEELRKAIVFHGHDLSSLYEEVPPSVLPVELGGTVDLPDYTEHEIEQMDATLETLWSRYKP